MCLSNVSRVTVRACDWQVRDGGECNLSEMTASDAGGLNTDAGRNNLVHHFEMKPVVGKEPTLYAFIINK